MWKQWKCAVETLTIGSVWGIHECQNCALHKHCKRCVYYKCYTLTTLSENLPNRMKWIWGRATFLLWSSAHGGTPEVGGPPPHVAPRAPPCSQGESEVMVLSGWGAG